MGDDDFWDTSNFKREQRRIMLWGVVVVVILALILLWIDFAVIPAVCDASIATDPVSFLSNLCQ